MPSTKRIDLHLALARIRRRVPWLLRRLKAEGLDIGESKLRAWVKGDEAYQGPSADEWRVVRKVLRGGGGK